MLRTIALILFLIWFAGLLFKGTLGLAGLAFQLLWALLIIALVLFVIDIIQGRRPPV